jgi:phage-related minor tail protein
MKPTDIQQFAIQAKLSMQLGPEVFDAIFVGTEIAGLSNGEMRVLARSEHCASVIEQNYLGMLAVIVESVLRRPVRFATVAPKNVRRCSEQ